jgi:hypothetical protein
MGGTDEESNLVRLTAREHFVCHLLLVKMTNGRFHYLMKNATVRFKKDLMTSRQYETVRRYRSESASYFQKGVPKSKEHKEKIRQSHLNLSPEKRARQLAGQKIKTKETRENMRRAALSRNPEHNIKIGLAQKGKKVSQESKDKLKSTLANTPPVTCPHCGKTGRLNGFIRWHFDKCKLKT